MGDKQDRPKRFCRRRWYTVNVHLMNGHKLGQNASGAKDAHESESGKSEMKKVRKREAADGNKIMDRQTERRRPKFEDDYEQHL